MTGAAPGFEGRTPHVFEPCKSIEYSPSILAQLRTAALEGEAASSSEILGVLFGRRDAGVVRILGFEPLESQLEFRSDFEPVPIETGEVLEPIGWYRAQRDGELALSVQDLQIFDRFFAKKWQITMVVQTAEETAPARVRVFFREPDEAGGATLSHREFLLQPLQPSLPEPAEVAPKPRLEPRAPRNIPWPLIIQAGIVVVGVALGFAFYLLTRVPPPLALRTIDTSGQLRITWDRGAVRQGESAQLEIIDGNERVWTELDSEQLRNGSITYTRRSNDVMVRMKLKRRGGALHQEVARYLGRSEQTMAADRGRPLDTTLDAFRERVASPGPVSPPPLRSAPPVQTPSPAASRPPNIVPSAPKKTEPANVSAPVPANPRRAEQAPATVVEKPLTQSAAGQTPAVEMPAATLVATAAASVDKIPPQVSQVPPSAPPVSPPASSEKPAQLIQRFPSPAETPAPPPRPAPETIAAPKETHAGPTSGRLIWIGRLQQTGAITIDGRNATGGTVEGELPGRPVRLSISPGDLSSDGLVLYTSNPQYRNSVIEPPGPQNGWNKTVYEPNAKRANDVTLAEPPGPQNGWKRLVLRSRNTKLSVIVVDWSVITQ